IVDLRTDAALAQVLPKVVPTAAGHPDAVDVEDVALTAWDLGRDHAGAAEELLVRASQLAPALVPLRKPTELDAEDGRLDLVEARVVSNDRVVVARRLSVLAERTELLCQPIVVRRDAPGFAVRAKVLRAIEREAVHAATRAGLLAVVEKRTVRLRRVFDDHDVAVLRDLAKRLQVDGAAIQVNGDDRLRAWS